MLRMKAADQLDANTERSWRPLLGESIWYLAGSGEGCCSVARTYGGYHLEFLGCDVREMFDVVQEAPSRSAVMDLVEVATGARTALDLLRTGPSPVNQKFEAVCSRSGSVVNVATLIDLLDASLAKFRGAK